MKCEICEIETEQLEVHHIIPRSRGGTNKESNLISICVSCHGKAHDVSFKRKTGLISEAAQRIKKEAKDANIWKENNQKYINEWFDKLLDKDLHMYTMLSELLCHEQLDSVALYKLVTQGKAKIKINIDLNNINN